MRTILRLCPLVCVAAFLFVFTAAACSGDSPDEAPAPEKKPETAAAEPALPEGAGAAGEKETLAFARAYPQRIAERAFRGGEWALRIDDAWYAWANGRLLPEAEKSRWKEFSVLRLYRYQRGLPPVPRLSEEEKARLRERLAADRVKPPARSEAFLSHLLGAATRREAEAQFERVSLMGFRFRLHRLAAESLKKVDAELAVLARGDKEAARFFTQISHIGSFNWRPIAGTGSRSYHAYGLALDFIAKNWGGKPYYWRNIMGWNPDWFELPYEKRWMIPQSIVEIFEKHGFVWGGKWLFFDTVHFEYRPEVFILSGS